MTEKSQPTQQALRFGAFAVDLRAGELYRNGRKIKLQERPFQVLAKLLVRPGEVVSKSELREKLWPADTFADVDHSLKTAISKIRDALGDSAESPRFIETVARCGYRFIAPVEKANTALHARTPAGGGRIRLAVLPFENVGSSVQEDSFTRGLMEETNTQLYRVSPPGALGVIARTSVMKYKRGNKNTHQVGRELHTDYVVEGSVRRQGTHVWVTARLVRIHDQRCVWSRTYEHDRHDMLAVQKDVAEKIACEVHEVLIPSAAGRNVSPEVKRVPSHRSLKSGK